MKPHDFLNNCSFCFKSKREVQKLVAGGAASICNECLILAIELCLATKSTKLGLEKVFSTIEQEAKGQTIKIDLAPFPEGERR
jgi:ATP-dependent protease Clp ATPase subunit